MYGRACIWICVFVFVSVNQTIVGSRLKCVRQDFSDSTHERRGRKRLCDVTMRSAASPFCSQSFAASRISSIKSPARPEVLLKRIHNVLHTDTCSDILFLSILITFSPISLLSTMKPTQRRKSCACRKRRRANTNNSSARRRLEGDETAHS